jgi:hypothetical protein
MKMKLKYQQKTVLFDTVTDGTCLADWKTLHSTNTVHRTEFSTAKPSDSQTFHQSFRQKKTNCSML